MSPFSYNSGVANGRKVVAAAATAEKLSATGLAATQVAITAETDNTGVIVVGGSEVVAALATRQGTPLAAGQTWSAEGVDLADIYLDTTVNGDGVTYSYTTD